MASMPTLPGSGPEHRQSRTGSYMVSGHGSRALHGPSGVAREAAQSDWRRTSLRRIHVIIALCVCLLGLALLFAKLWSDSKAEIVALRNQIASLKRQLKSGRS